MANTELQFAIRAINQASAELKRVQADIDDLGRDAETAAQRTNRFGGSLTDVSKVAGGFLLAQGILQAPAVLGSMARAAADDAASMERLKVAVENSGASWDELADSLDETIALAQKRAFTDDQARGSLALLTAQTGSAEEAQRRFALAMDLSRGANIDLETASKLLGRVTEENVNVLGRYGITIQQGASQAELWCHPGEVRRPVGRINRTPPQPPPSQSRLPLPGPLHSSYQPSSW